MANSTITLYKDCKIIPSKIFRIDSIEDYLNTLTKYIKQDFQWIKLALNLTIKIDMSQYGLAFNSNNVNYLKVENDVENISSTPFPAYYFITEKKWISASTWELTLEMDTINTFTETNGAFTWDKRTKIVREHKDRWELITSGEFTGRFKPIMDKEIEGINPILYKQSSVDTDLTDTRGVDTNWYLIYKNRSDDSSPVDCFLTTDEQLNVKIKTNKLTISVNDIVDGFYYFIPIRKQFISNNSKSYIGRTGDTYIYLGHEITTNIYEYAIKKNGDKFDIYLIRGGKYVDYSRLTATLIESNVTSIEFQSAIESISLRKASNYTPRKTQSSFFNAYVVDMIDTYVPNGTDEEFTNSGSTTALLKTINDVDRTDSTIIKIIKLPYAPSNYELINDVFSFLNDEWIFDGTTSWFKLTDINNKFKNKLETLQLPFRALTPKVLNLGQIDRDDSNEPKLHHSEFEYTKFVYDTFSFTFQLEKVDTTDFTTNDYVLFTYEFIVTTTINSKFMFRFPQYTCGDYADNDYNNILIVARSNEITLYNSAYINYIKNGLNYDIKTKDRTITASWLGIGLSAVGTAASFIGGIFTGGATIPVGIALATSTAAQVASAINSTKSAEESQQEKIAQLKAQATSVSGSDDVDLMSEYTGNRAKIVRYRCSNKMYKSIADLFYYCGYIANYLGVPNLHSRKFFNFILCDLVINPIFNLNNDIIEDMKQKYSAGVTIIHALDDNTYWDFEQTRENWEVSIYE